MTDPFIDEAPQPQSFAEIAVAVIDDDELVTMLVERLLQRMGFKKIYRVTQSPLFLDMLAEGVTGLHLVICDIGMPDVDGLQILEAVRKQSPDLPFLMLTADGSGETVRRAIDGGVTGYMVKPLNPDTLTEKVRTTVERAYGIK